MRYIRIFLSLVLVLLGGAGAWVGSLAIVHEAPKVFPWPRRAANPVATLEFELQQAKREAAEVRLAGAARDFHAAGASEVALRTFLAAVRQELYEAEGRGFSEGAWWAERRKAREEGPPK